MTNDAAAFWAGYEKEHGEKVLSHSLGRYTSGWMDWKNTLWGLLIATDAGFRFHHFPYEGWIQALSRTTTGGGEAPKEKTLFIPLKHIKSIELICEESWWKRLIFARPPVCALNYTKDDGGTGRLLLETDKTAIATVDALLPLLAKDK